jgi:hypothetical protein
MSLFRWNGFWHMTQASPLAHAHSIIWRLFLRYSLP